MLKHRIFSGIFMAVVFGGSRKRAANQCYKSGDDFLHFRRFIFELG